MFSKATANFVRQIDPEGSLIPVSRVNDSRKLVPMALVVKRKRVWFWQRPKYQPTDFTLSDLLQGDEVLIPGVSEKDFLVYSGTYGNQFSGSLDAGPRPVSITLEGSGTSQLQTCFGHLIKEELIVKKLLYDSRKRLVDMEHTLVQQLEKRAEVLAVVKERILTTSSCPIKQIKKEQCIFQGLLGMLGLLGLLSSSFEISVKDKSNIEVDSDVSVEIPAGTVIAYSIMNLEIKKDGRFEFCLRDNMTGGFEADSLLSSSDFDLDVVDSGVQKLSLNALLNGSEEMDLSALAELPESTRHVFFDKLQETLRDRPALTCLQFVLEDMCNGDTLASENGETSDGQKKSLTANLDQPCPDRHSGNGHCAASAQLNAAHVLVSALEELPDETLNLLSNSSREDLKALDMLMCRLKESSGPLSADTLPVLLQDDQRCQLAERLLDSAKVTLRRDGGCLSAEKESHAGVLPLVLCLSVHGLAVLCSGPE